MLNTVKLKIRPIFQSFTFHTMIFRTLFFFSFLYFSLTVNVDKPNSLSRRVETGENARRGEFPYHVSIKSYNQHFCGGAIIKKKYILSAAHCLENYIRLSSSIKIVAGTLKLSKPGINHYVEKIIIHEEFSRSSGENDIALVKVKNSFVFNKFINFIRLPKANQTLNADQMVLVTSWGKNYFDGFITNDLQRFNLLIANQTFCKEKYAKRPFRVSDSHICASNPDLEEGTCQFDSGAPLTMNGVLVGIFSWGDSRRCGGYEYPLVFTKASNYLNWINDNSVDSP